MTPNPPAPSSEPMRLVVVGAGGRMGKSLIKAISETPGVVLHAAIEREGSPLLGQDSGVVAGLMPNGVPITEDALTAFVKAQGVLGFHDARRHCGFRGPRRRRRASCMSSHDRTGRSRFREAQGRGAAFDPRPIRQFQPRREHARRAREAGGQVACRLAGISRSSRCITA